MTLTELRLTSAVEPMRKQIQHKIEAADFYIPQKQKPGNGYRDAYGRLYESQKDGSLRLVPKRVRRSPGQKAEPKTKHCTKNRG